MRTTPLAIAVLLGAMATAAQTPARPDFSGEWVLDPARSTSTGVPARIGGPAPGAAQTKPPIQAPRKIKDVAPVYPVTAQQSGIGGMVVLEATIDRQGKVADVRVLRSIKELDRAAMEAVAKWEYTPTLVDGVAVPVIMTVTLTFSVAGSTPDSRNRLPGTGGALDNMYTYVSRWEDNKLVSIIRWTGPQGQRERTETISIDGDTLTMQTSRAPVDPGGQPIVQTNAFTRKK